MIKNRCRIVGNSLQLGAMDQLKITIDPIIANKTSNIDQLQMKGGSRSSTSMQDSINYL